MKRFLKFMLPYFAVSILGVAVLYAADNIPAPKKETVPVLSADAKIRLLGYAIKQRDIRIRMQNLQNQYAVEQKNMDNVNVAGQAEEVKDLKELNLDPSKYATQTTEAGDVIVVKQ